MLRPLHLWGLALMALTLPSVAALAGEPTHDVCPIAQRPAWHHVKSAHFSVRTSLDPVAAQRTTLNLERFLAALLPIWGPNFKLEGTVEVILVRDSELAEFVQGNVRGFLATGNDDARFMVIALEPAEVTGSPRGLPTLTHELAHYLLDRIYPRAPRWFSEGFATYLEAVELRPGDREGVVGMLKMGHLNYVKAHGVLDMEAMWRWDDEFSLHDPVKLRHQYASAWMWVHYLLARHAAALGRFQLALSQLEDPRQAWAAAFGAGLTLEEGLKAHASARRYDASSYAVGAVPMYMEVKALPHAEVHAIRARLWGKAPNDMSEEERLKRIRLELNQAMREDATHVEVARLQSDVLYNAQERLERARALVQARPEASGAWTLLGRALRGTGAPLAQQEKAFLRAWELMPDSTTTLYDMASYYLERDLPDKALEPALRAVQLAPDSAAMRSVLAATLLARGQCDPGLLHLRKTIALARDRPDTSDLLPALSRDLARYEEACRKAKEAAKARPAK